MEFKRLDFGYICKRNFVKMSEKLTWPEYLSENQEFSMISTPFPPQTSMVKLVALADFYIEVIEGRGQRKL